MSPFDRAVDGMRQPGSSFKPIVYATAIADSMTPVTPVGDTAIAVPLPNGRYYRPEDSDNKYLGVIPMREALAKSRNIVRGGARSAARNGFGDRDCAPDGNLIAHRACAGERDRRVCRAAARSRRRVHDLREPRHTRAAAFHLSRRRCERAGRARATGARARRPALDPQRHLRHARHDARRRRSRNRDGRPPSSSQLRSRSRGKTGTTNGNDRCLVRRRDSGGGRRRLDGLRPADADRRAPRAARSPHLSGDG